MKVMKDLEIHTVFPIINSKITMNYNLMPNFVLSKVIFLSFRLLLFLISAIFCDPNQPTF